MWLFLEVTKQSSMMPEGECNDDCNGGGGGNGGSDGGWCDKGYGGTKMRLRHFLKMVLLIYTCIIVQ
jgi:hypothetical protein